MRWPAPPPAQQPWRRRPPARAQSDPVPSEGGDPSILNLPAHSTGLGQPVATDGYGKPSGCENNVQCRPSPGLTQTAQSSVSLAPLQLLFGIVTPSGLHFERHHQGWWDVDPSGHRLMLNGSDSSLMKTPKVLTMDEPVRLPSVSRFHFIECGANSGMEWGNVAVPTVPYSHGLLSCSEFTGVTLKRLLDQCGVNCMRARYLLGEGTDGSSMTRTLPVDLVEGGEVLVVYGQNGEMLRPATPRGFAARNIDVRPDFKGLPAGSGSLAQGQDIWEAKCASCRGVFGESNEVFSPLVGGTTAADVKTGRVARLLDPAQPGRTMLMKAASLSTH